MESNTAKIRQGFLGGPSRVVYTPGSENESTELCKRLEEVVKNAGGFSKFFIDVEKGLTKPSKASQDPP